MNEIAIRAENLGKRYAIGERERYVALRDILSRAATAPARWFRSSRKNGHGREHIWALRDVSFAIQQGEVVGLVGRNGAGKTTLLKILARVTRPTTGFAEVRGRMGTLLEVGTGFHPELTGRENVFLSGAILGMSKQEIERKFDQMVDFAGVEQFIDTPLKHYSTGMQMRLAFGVAAHLEPEILLVDEVLAVGDAAFQKKCLGKMSEVAQGGRTIVFVSHQMNQIRRLCQRVLWIDQGQIRADGPAGEVVAAYEAAQMEPDQSPSGSHCFLSWEIAGQGHTLKDNFIEVEFRIRVHLANPISNGHLGIGIENEAGFTVVGWGFDGLNVATGLQEFVLKVPLLPLRPGAYTIICALFNEGNNLTNGKSIERWYGVPPLIVDTAPLAHPQDRWAGVLNIPGALQVAEPVLTMRSKKSQ